MVQTCRTVLTAGVVVALGMRAVGADATLGDTDIALHGFLDGRAGVRLANDPYQDTLALGEVRAQVDVSAAGASTTWRVRADLVYDDVVGGERIDLETGRGLLDLREANVLLSPLSFMDVKAGRQILTWGTGDLLFINDLFPKDWQSFFTGRDVEYLKAPSDALFVSLFPSFASIDLAYTPRFDADRHIRGERLSYWNPMLGRRVGQDAEIDPVRPDDWFEDDELALRVSRTLGGYELAAYGYDGYWKSPVGFDPVAGRATFPRLSVYGASARGTLAGGILNLEGGYYDSRDDRGERAALAPNSETRALVGYEHEIVRNLTGAVQAYLERLDDYRAYRAGVPAGTPMRDEDRTVLTARLTQQLMNQNLVLSLFAYYSPSDADAYLRPGLTYKASDALLLTVGANTFHGRDDHTFFGQFEKNSNVYAGLRYSY